MFSGEHFITKQIDQNPKSSQKEVSFKVITAKKYCASNL